MLLLEKEDTVGGLARSIYYKGFIMDFCAHRFHTGNQNLLNEVLALDGLEMTKHMKKSRIYMFKKYLRYPFELQNLFRAMSFLQFIRSSLSFAFNKIFIKPNPSPVSYKQWFEKYYGKRALADYDFSKADTIVGIDSDFLGDWQGGGYEKEYAEAKGPKKRNNKAVMSWHMQFESNMSLTGVNADHRVPCTPAEQKKVLEKAWDLGYQISAHELIFGKE